MYCRSFRAVYTLMWHLPGDCDTDLIACVCDCPSRSFMFMMSIFQLLWLWADLRNRTIWFSWCPSTPWLVGRSPGTHCTWVFKILVPSMHQHFCKILNLYWGNSRLILWYFIRMLNWAPQYLKAPTTNFHIILLCTNRFDPAQIQGLKSMVDVKMTCSIRHLCSL